MVVLVAVLLAVCMALAAVVLGQRRRIDALTAALTNAVGDEVAEVITIEIRNHAEVAASRSALAKPLALLTPGILRNIVHRETVKMMRSELADNGVDADVRLRRVGPRVPVDPDPPEPADG